MRDSARPREHAVVPAASRGFAVVAVLAALTACAGTHSASASASARHAAHGHVVAAIERPNADAMMLERVEDEDTVWIDLPSFGACPFPPGEIPPHAPVDDGHVPGLGPARTRMTNMDAGDEKIHNEALLQRLERATTEVLQCVSLSACYDERALQSGSIDFRFEVAPDGKVRGVQVDPSPGLDHTGVRECARLAIWQTHFPAFDGADMLVSYRLDID